MKTIAVLFARSDSAYKDYNEFDVYDIERDAREYAGKLPVLAHPPCRAWGRLSHMANPREGEKQLAYLALAQVRLNGGVLEHPSGSKFWMVDGMPKDGELDAFGGYIIMIDQWDFEHVARKSTKLYICGISKSNLPPLPNSRGGTPLRSIAGNVKNTVRCTQYQREYTPILLIKWLRDVAIKIVELSNIK